MRLVEIKDELARYQQIGNWNQSVQYLLNIYNSGCFLFADTLVVSEFYWLMIDKDYLRTCSPDLYNSISWSFEKQFIDIFDTSRCRQENNFNYQWVVGMLISISPEPLFMQYSSKEIRAISEGIARRGRILSNASDIQYLFRFTDDITYGGENIVYNRAKLLSELNSICFRENLSDKNLKNHLLSLINRYCSDV